MHALTLRFLIPFTLVVLLLAGCGDSDARLDTSEPWDLVWISDSMGEQVSYRWADQIEESEGVEVRVHDYVIGFLSMEKAQQMITNDATIREEAADAEIIVVYGNNSDTGPAD